MANSLLQPVLDAVSAYRQDQESLEQLVHVASQQLGEDWLNALQTLPDSLGVDPEKKAELETKIGHAVQYYNALNAWQMAEGFVNAQAPDVASIEENLPAMEYWLASFGEPGEKLLEQVKALLPAGGAATEEMKMPTPAAGYDEAMNSLMADIKEYSDFSEETTDQQQETIPEQTMPEEIPLDEALEQAQATRTEPIGVPAPELTEEQILAPEVVAQNRMKEEEVVPENTSENEGIPDVGSIDFSVFDQLTPEVSTEEKEQPETASGEAVLQEKVVEDIPVERDDVVPEAETAAVLQDIPIETEEVPLETDSSETVEIPQEQEETVSAASPVPPVKIISGTPLTETVSETQQQSSEVVPETQEVSESSAKSQSAGESSYQKPAYAEEGVSYDIPFEVAHFLRERALYEGMDSWIGSRCVNLNQIEKTEYPYYGVLVDLMRSVVSDCDALMSRSDLGNAVETWIPGGRKELIRLREALNALIDGQEDMYKNSLEDLLNPEKMREVLGKLDLSNRKEKRDPAPDGFELIDDPFSENSTAEMENKFKTEVGSSV